MVLTAPELVQRIVEHLTMGLDFLRTAGQAMAAFLDRFPHQRSLLVHHGLQPSTITTLERIGRKTLHPSLAFDTSIPATRLKSMSYDEQERYLNEPVELLVPQAGTSEMTSKLALMKSLSKDQLQQVLDGTKVRDLAEQNTYLLGLESQRRFKMFDDGKSWKIVKNEVRVKRDSSLSKADILEILERLVNP